MSITVHRADNLSTTSAMTKAVSSASSASGTTTKKNKSSSLTADDFLYLFVKQLQNQDATSPMDDTTMMSQITQLSNMQMMQDMKNYSQSNYAVSLVGKYVKANVTDEVGNTSSVSGTIDRMTSADGEYTFYIGDKSFSSDDITEVATTPTKTETPEDGKKA